MKFQSKEDRTTRIKEVIKENRKLITNIKKRIKNINSKFENTPFTKEFMDNYTLGSKNQRDMTNSQILKLHENLLMLNRKSYTRVNTYAKYNDLQESLNDLGVDNERVWRLYDQIVEERVLMNDKYKYEVVRYMTYMVSRGLNDGEIRDRVMNIEQKLYEQTSYDDEDKLKKINNAQDTASFDYNEFLEIVDLL